MSFEIMAKACPSEEDQKEIQQDKTDVPQLNFHPEKITLGSS